MYLNVSPQQMMRDTQPRTYAKIEAIFELASSKPPNDARKSKHLDCPRVLSTLMFRVFTVRGPRLSQCHAYQRIDKLYAPFVMDYGY